MPRLKRNNTMEHRRRKFGRELQRYRTWKGLTQEALGGRTNYSGSFIGQVENGKICQREFAVAQDEALGLPGTLTDLWDSLFKPGAFPTWFTGWSDHEAEAEEIRSYEGFVVDGLLQTEKYAASLLRGDETAIAARMARQSILTRQDPPPPHLWVVLDQSVLLRQVGDAVVMREQLERLAAIDSDRISVQVVPLRQHRGVSGSFTLATFPDGSEIGYMDTARQGMIVEDSEDIDKLARSFDQIRSAALPVDMSRDLILRTVERRWT